MAITVQLQGLIAVNHARGSRPERRLEYGSQWHLGLTLIHRSARKLQIQVYGYIQSLRECHAVTFVFALDEEGLRDGYTFGAKSTAKGILGPKQLNGELICGIAPINERSWSNSLYTFV